MILVAASYALQLTYPFERWAIGKSLWPHAYQLDDDERREKLFDAILTEGNVTAGCEKIGINRSTVYRHAARNKKFKEEFDAICDYLFHCLRDDAISIADKARAKGSGGDPFMASLVRTQVDARLRVAGLHKPNVEVNVDNRKVSLVCNDEERSKLIEARARALALQDKPQE